MNILNQRLINNFPELKNEIINEMNEYDGWDTDMYAMYENVFVPYIVDRVLKKDIKTIEKIFKYIEELVSSNDEYTKNTADVSIIECLWAYQDIREEIKKYFLPRSLKSYLDLDKEKYEKLFKSRR